MAEFSRGKAERGPVGTAGEARNRLGFVRGAAARAGFGPAGGKVRAFLRLGAQPELAVCSRAGLTPQLSFTGLAGQIKRLFALRPCPETTAGSAGEGSAEQG